MSSEHISGKALSNMFIKLNVFRLSTQMNVGLKLKKEVSHTH